MGKTIEPHGSSTVIGARLDHVAFGVASMRDAARFLVSALGGEPVEGGPGPGYTGAQWRFAGGARLECIEPAGEDGFLHRFLRARGPGIHHVTFVVPKLEHAARRAAELGYEVVGYNDMYPSWKECFLHPKQALGIVVQMAEKSDEPGAANAWGPGFPFPEWPRAAPAAEVVGLRLAASRDSAVRQWRELLGGELEETNESSLRFRWPDSPIVLAVDTDGSAPEGPRWIEVRSARPLALPASPDRALGAMFVEVDSKAP